MIIVRSWMDLVRRIKVRNLKLVTEENATFDRHVFERLFIYESITDILIAVHRRRAIILRPEGAVVGPSRLQYVFKEQMETEEHLVAVTRTAKAVCEGFQIEASERQRIMTRLEEVDRIMANTNDLIQYIMNVWISRPFGGLSRRGEEEGEEEEGEERSGGEQEWDCRAQDSQEEDCDGFGGHVHL